MDQRKASILDIELFEAATNHDDIEVAILVPKFWIEEELYCGHAFHSDAGKLHMIPLLKSDSESLWSRYCQ